MRLRDHADHPRGGRINPSGSVATSDQSPAWDPFGSHIAFIRQFSLKNVLLGDLCLHEVATGVERALTSFNLVAGEGAFGRPAWSPDRSQIAKKAMLEHPREDANDHERTTPLPMSGMEAGLAWL